MDRTIVYPLEETTETDLLNTNKFAMIALAKLAVAILGTGPHLHGLACTPGAGLTVSVAAGQILKTGAIDATAYSSLGADSHTILKQGLVLDATALSCPAPTTAGKSINYLVQIGYADTDTGGTVLPFYNASNPAIPFTGPGGSGAAVSTVRAAQCLVQVKAGAAANTGSQTTPAADSGFVAAYVVQVDYGMAAIPQANITVASGAPFLAGLLNSHHGGGAGQAPKVDLATETTGTLPLSNLPTGLTIWCGTSTGAANAQVVAVPTGMTTFPTGTGIAWKVGAGLTNTSALTVTVGGFGTCSVLKDGPTGPIPLTGGELVAGQVANARFDGTILQLSSTELGTAALANASSNTGVVAAVNGVATVGQVPTFTDTAGTVGAGRAVTANTGKLAAVQGSPTIGHMAVFDANGSLQDGGIAGVAAAPTYLNYANANNTVLGPGAYNADTLPANGGAFTVLLPAAPAIGAALDFTDVSGSWNTNYFTLGRNGNTIEGLSEDFVFNVAGLVFRIEWNGTTWRLI
ncbi:hypothetical protein GJ699_02655 [Duganella sp. FT80W]|uniref:Uncharacterized protein n=1 Tax=Duganella guangzhouensis TaxID=2666084 RepID=A0A6I2KXY6_9BURK|nr:hypothetical protein [Duganella guangzhouensis]MRW88879.1 hypothetical protein [Duganella guangzhouensis]